MSPRATAALDFSTTLARSRRLRSKYDLCQASLHEGRTNPSRRLPLMKTARFWQDSPKFVRIRELGVFVRRTARPLFSLDNACGKRAVVNRVIALMQPI